MSDDETLFHCDECYKRKEVSPSTIQKRHETTRLHNEDGIFLIAICHRCGGVMKPYLEELDESDLWYINDD